jgi:transposase
MWPAARPSPGLDRVEVAVPQAHLPGAEAEVGFGEFHAMIAGVLVKVWLFVLRLSCSGRAFHAAFATQAQEAFLEGHVLAFEHFGAVPGRIRYDNLKPAVARVLRGRDRAGSERFIALRSHYGFDSFFCIPGKEGAHEKVLASHCTSWAGCGNYWLARFLLPAGRPVALRGVTSGIW